MIFIKPRWYMVYKIFSKLLKLYKSNFKSWSQHLACITRKYFKRILKLSPLGTLYEVIV